MANALRALAEAALLAETLGLEGCMSETARSALDNSRRARKILCLPRRKKILGVLLVGRPLTVFPRAAGLLLPVRWINGRSSNATPSPDVSGKPGEPAGGELLHRSAGV